MKKTVNVQGIETSYIEEGSGTSVIFLHGWMGSSVDFPTFFPLASKQYRAISIDLPGFGDTPPFSGEVTLQRYAEFIKSFTVELGIRTHHIVGNCFGGTVGLEYVRLKPKGLGKSILITPIFYREVLQPYTRLIVKIFGFKPARVLVSFFVSQDWFMDLVLRIFFGKRKRQYNLDAKSKKQKADHENAYKVAVQLCSSDYRGIYGELDSPLKIVTYKPDLFVHTEKISREIEKLPQAEEYCIKGGHLTDPDNLLQDYKNLLKFL